MDRRGFGEKVAASLAGGIIFTDSDVKAVSKRLRARGVSPSDRPSEFTRELNIAMEQEKFSYRGWEVMWTGWKTSQESLDLCGQWVARKPTCEYRLYSSAPGAAGRIHKGECVNLAVMSNQAIPSFHSPISELVRSMTEARAVLFGLIDQEV